MNFAKTITNVKFQNENSSVFMTDLERSWKSDIIKYFSFFDIQTGSASKMDVKWKIMGKFIKSWTYPQFWLLDSILRHFLEEFWKSKSSLLLYFFMIFPNLLKNFKYFYFEILAFLKKWQISLTSMAFITEDTKLKFYRDDHNHTDRSKIL